MTLPVPQTLTDAACAVLNEPEPCEKVRLTFAYGQQWQDGIFHTIGTMVPPQRPARPEKPRLCPPTDMPKRSTGTGKRRTALIHAIAHIELNAIDLAWDIVARFVDQDLPKAFYTDWVQVAVDEARHFEMLQHRLQDLNASYGDSPAHDGLWEAAKKTQHDILARLCLIPMVLEARGLDTTPATVARLLKNGDEATADLMSKICEDEISHVAAGVKWFEYVCSKQGKDPVITFKSLLANHYKGQLKPPFNHQARATARMNRAYYDLKQSALETSPKPE